MPHVRCSKCRARYGLTRQPAEYRRLPRCPRCKRTMVADPIDRREPHWVIDHYRQRVERDPKLTCYPGRGGCDEYSFPHRRGSGYCIHNPNLTEEDLIDRWETGSWS